MRTIFMLGIAVLLTAGALAPQDEKIYVEYVEEGTIKLDTYTCAQHMKIVEVDDSRRDVQTVWTHGFYTAHHFEKMKSEQLSWNHISDFYNRLQADCKVNPDRLIVEVLKEME